jgi:hypothetical protein
MADTAPEALVRHAGALVVAALVALTLLAWLALLAGAGTDMDPAAMSFWLACRRRCCLHSVRHGRPPIGSSPSSCGPSWWWR